MLSKMRVQRKRVFNSMLATSLITLLSLVSILKPETIQSKGYISTFKQESTSLQRGWKSRRLLQGEKDRPAPRGFPPPDGNALVHDPQRAPPSKRAWIPGNPPPPHP